MAGLGRKSALFGLAAGLVFASFLLSDFISKKRITSKLEPQSPNIILISLDGLRPDHLGCYGYHKNTSENIDRASQEGVIFKNHFSQSPQTVISHLSLFCSLYPEAMGWSFRQYKKFLFGETVPVLAEILQAHGYYTGAFVRKGLLRREYGFDKGFSCFTEKVDLEGLLPAVHKWISDNYKRKFFIFIHSNYMLPPYTVARKQGVFNAERRYLRKQTKLVERNLDKLINGEVSLDDLSAQEKSALIWYSMTERFPGRYRIMKLITPQIRKQWADSSDYQRQRLLLIDAYDAQIRRADYFLGRLFLFLKAVDLWDDTLVIITSGLGQELMEHRLFAGEAYLYDTLLHIPLIVKPPSSVPVAARQIDSLTEAIDIMPTILAITGINPAENIQGRDLLTLITAEKTDLKNAVFSSYRNRNAVRTDTYKYITLRRKIPFFQPQLYDIRSNPLESTNIFSEDHSEANRLDQLLQQHRRQCDIFYNMFYGNE